MASIDYTDLLKRLSESKESELGFGKLDLSDFGDQENVDKKIEQKGKILDNQAKKQDIDLKKWTLIGLFVFLGLETIAVFWYTYLQATKQHNFALEEWSFKLLIASTISQITFMLHKAVVHLFPQTKS